MERLLTTVSQEIEDRLVEICLRQDCFHSNSSARTLFTAGELWEKKHGMPEGNSIRDRVEKVLKYAEEQGVLELLVQALRDRTYPGMWDYHQLNRILNYL